MRSFLLVLLLLSATTLSAQDTVRHVGTFPVSRYEGGPQAFYKFLGETLEYPRQAREAARVGTSVVEVTLSPEGTFVNLEIINPLGEGIDEDLLQTFRKAEDQWLALPGVSPIRMYFVITYMINDQPFYRMTPDTALFQEEVVVNAYGNTRHQPRPHARLIENLHKFREKKKFKRALRFADELIRRDPLNSQWYLLRSNINSELDHREAVCQDLSKLRHFLQVPVTKELMQQYCN